LPTTAKLQFNDKTIISADPGLKFQTLMQAYSFRVGLAGSSAIFFCHPFLFFKYEMQSTQI
jgi:hypothetical protein